jgi:hypothetical protein
MKLISGSSFIYKSEWPKLLLGNNVLNVAKDALCNWYVSSSVINNYNSDIEFVYVQFTYVNKISVPSAKQSYKFMDDEYVHNDKHITWIPSGGEWANWVKQPKSQYYSTFKNFYTSDTKDTLLATNWYTLYHVMNCLNFLEKKNVNYLFGWDYDPFKSSLASIGGYLTSSHDLYNEIDWSKCVKPYMYDYCESIDEVTECKTHPTEQGCVKWVDQVKDQFPDSQ